MIDELAELNTHFPGRANQTRCFNHVLSLVAKSIIRQFDLPKAQADEALTAAEKELFELAAELDLEEESMAGDNAADDDDEDDLEGWVDERKGMSPAERKLLDVSVQPVRLVLVKVRAQLRM
jgi:cob(I)alamin adenosyltransferase